MVMLLSMAEAISVNTVLNKLDPMGQKTSATTLFIRVCARMDKTDATDMLTS
jgi:hypothetical protein